VQPTGAGRARRLPAQSAPQFRAGSAGTTLPWTSTITLTRTSPRATMPSVSLRKERRPREAAWLRLAPGAEWETGYCPDQGLHCPLITRSTDPRPLCALQCRLRSPRIHDGLGSYAGWLARLTTSHSPPATTFAADRDGVYSSAILDLRFSIWVSIREGGRGATPDA
jgi:hypothetical protein